MSTVSLVACLVYGVRKIFHRHYDISFHSLINNVLFVGCETDIRIISDRLSGLFSPGDVFTCLAPIKHAHKQSYKWTDSSGVIVSYTSTTMLHGEGSFNLTCTITDERPACDDLSASISGNITGKIQYNATYL